MAKLRDRERQSACVGVTQCIEVGLTASDGLSTTDESETFLSHLRSTLHAVEADQHPPERAEEVPTWEALRARLAGVSLAAETLRVCAATGPWRLEAAVALEATTPDPGSGAGMYDFGGETEEGKARAAQLAKAGRAGDPEAQFQLGVMFFTANGVAKDGASALKWLKMAANLGHSQAQNCVGVILRNGLEGQTADKPQAAQWFAKAAGQGFAEAQYNLGEMYDEADGIEYNEAEAFRWFETAAEGGLAQAQYKAGIMLHTGNGVDRDVARSIPLITRAGEQGLPQALHTLGTLHYSGDGVVLDKVAAGRYFTQAAEAGDALAQYSIGVMLELGDGVERDLGRSQHWLRLAAAQGLVEAQARCQELPLLEGQRPGSGTSAR